MKKKDTSETDEKIKKEIASNIKRIRRSTRTYLTAERVAERLEMTRAGYTQIENGKNNINGVTLWKLSMLFGCGIKEFFPIRLDGYELSPKDIKEIKKKDEEAIQWAEDLWGSIKQK